MVKARRKAQESDVVVVNHHLLFADLAIKREGFGEILPGAQAFILDEAHQIAEVASQFFTLSVSYRQLTELCRDTLTEAAAQTGGLALLQPAVTDLEQAHARVPPGAGRSAEQGLVGHGGRAPRRGRCARCARRRRWKRLVAALEAQAERSTGLEAAPRALRVRLSAL